jgi:hypothetical protein
MRNHICGVWYHEMLKEVNLHIAIANIPTRL